MYLTTQGYTKAFATITSKLPGFDGYFAEFTKNNDHIKKIKEQLEHMGYGITENKENLRTKLIDKTLDVSGKIEVYANMSGNVILAKEIHYSQSDLNKSRSTALIDKALMVFSKATEYAKDTETYGVTAALLTDLKESIDKYNEAMPTIRITRTTKKMDFSTLKTLFKVNDSLLGRMDMLVELVKKSNADFYLGYKTNRKVIARGKEKIALMVKIVSASDDTAIKGAKATITPKIDTEAKDQATSNAKPTVKKSATKGGFSIKKIPEGIYTIAIEKLGYAPKSFVVKITGVEMTKLEVKLEKN